MTRAALRSRLLVIATAFVVAAAAVGLACGDESFTASPAPTPPGSDGASPSDAIASDAPASGDASDASTPSGPCPPRMVLVTSIAGRSFCIDRAEVTQAEYRDFMKANDAKTTAQPAYCSWNDTFIPQNSPECAIDPIGRADYPMVCVDWCDARAYCAWQNKRLCGSLVDGGARNPGEQFDEWESACTKNGVQEYPYGGSYVAGRCNVLEKRDGAVATVDADPECVGAFGDLVDMVGNVKEWVNDCAELTTFTDDCLAAGGSFTSNGPDASCRRRDNGDISFQLADVGFRCCANAKD